MANADTIFGARQVGNIYGSAYTGAVHPYTVLAADAVALFVGDFVKLTGTASPDQQGIERPVVAQAAATNTLVGFVVGFAPDPDNLSRIYRTASTLRTVLVCDDPNATFEIQSDSSAALVAADIGLNADITVAAGDTVSGLSGMELDHSTVASATFQLRILGLSPRADNEFGINAKVICMINEHSYKSTTGV